MFLKILNVKKWLKKRDKNNVKINVNIV